MNVGTLTIPFACSVGVKICASMITIHGKQIQTVITASNVPTIEKIFIREMPLTLKVLVLFLSAECGAVVTFGMDGGVVLVVVVNGLCLVEFGNLASPSLTPE